MVPAVHNKELPQALNSAGVRLDPGSIDAEVVGRGGVGSAGGVDSADDVYENAECLEFGFDDDDDEIDDDELQAAVRKQFDEDQASFGESDQRTFEQFRNEEPEGYAQLIADAKSELRAREIVDLLDEEDERTVFEGQDQATGVVAPGAQGPELPGSAAGTRPTAAGAADAAGTAGSEPWPPQPWTKSHDFYHVSAEKFQSLVDEGKVALEPARDGASAPPPPRPSNERSPPTQALAIMSSEAEEMARR